MKLAVKNSYSYATYLLEYLITKGIAMRDAHETISSLVKYCEQNKKYFQDLSLDEFKKFSSLFDTDVFNIV